MRGMHGLGLGVVFALIFDCFVCMPFSYWVLIVSYACRSRVGFFVLVRSVDEVASDSVKRSLGL